MIPLWDVIEGTVQKYGSSLSQAERQLKLVRVCLDDGTRLVGLRFPVSLVDTLLDEVAMFERRKEEDQRRHLQATALTQRQLTWTAPPQSAAAALPPRLRSLTPQQRLKVEALCLVLKLSAGAAEVALRRNAWAEDMAAIWALEHTKELAALQEQEQAQACEREHEHENMPAQGDGQQQQQQEPQTLCNDNVSKATNARLMFEDPTPIDPAQRRQSVRRHRRSRRSSSQCCPSRSRSSAHKNCFVHADCNQVRCW